jgi:hypothetical protein
MTVGGFPRNYPRLTAPKAIPSPTIMMAVKMIAFACRLKEWIGKLYF